MLNILSLFGDSDMDFDGIWDSVDDCVGAYDECGVCNGPGPQIPIIESITTLYDSVYAEQIDEWIVFELGSDTTFQFICFHVLGCTDPGALNFNPDATLEDGSCCQEWCCGLPVEYHGYSYETVMLGEQCWFAENLRTTQWSNGQEIPQPLYLENPGSGEPACMPNFDESAHGYWYNYGACSDSRDLCPSGFHVPTIDELESLLQFVSSPEDLIHGPFNAGIAGLWYGNGSTFGFRAYFQSTTTLPPPNTTINQQLMVVPADLVEEWGETGIVNNTIAAGCSVRCIADQ